jgi:SAM-dependent methyltransferase
VLEFDVIGLINGEPRGRMYVGYHTSSPDHQDYPPPEVMKRASGNSGQPFWRATGIKNCHDMLRPMAPYLKCESIGSLLEWGCGSGRLTTHLINVLPNAQVSGTDIDAEAVSWAANNLKGSFRPCQTEPPLPFEDPSSTRSSRCRSTLI